MPFSNTRLYQQVRDNLIERIASGEWKPNTFIPNEHDLARQLGVSQGTMRKALGMLEEEGLIMRRPGRGTVVTDQTSSAHIGRYSNLFIEDQRILGTMHTCAAERSSATALERERLRLHEGAEVYRIRRIRSHDDEPFLVEDVCMPVALFPDLGDGLGVWWLTEIAARHGILLGAAVETARAGPASLAASRQLSIPEHAPVLILDRVIATRDSRFAEWRHAECVTENVHMKLEMQL